MVLHGWMDMVFEWMGFNEKLLNLIKWLNWKTRLEVVYKGNLQKSLTIIFLRGGIFTR